MGKLRWKVGVGLYREGEDPRDVAQRREVASNIVHAALTVLTLGAWGVLV